MHIVNFLLVAAAVTAAAQGPPPCPVSVSIAGGDANNVFSTEAVLTATVQRLAGSPSIPVEGLVVSFQIKPLSIGGVSIEKIIKTLDSTKKDTRKGVLAGEKKSERLFSLDLAKGSNFFALVPDKYELMVSFTVPGTVNIMSPVVAGEMPAPSCQSVQSVVFEVVAADDPVGTSGQ